MGLLTFKGKAGWCLLIHGGPRTCFSALEMSTPGAGVGRKSHGTDLMGCVVGTTTSAVGGRAGWRGGVRDARCVAGCGAVRCG